MSARVRVHDVVGPVTMGSVCAEDSGQQDLVDRCLAWAPFAVARRVTRCDGRVAVGVRGVGRDERYAAWMLPEDVLRVAAPEELLSRKHGRMLPAYVALEELMRRWRGWAWGPAGSVGFELASGVACVHAGSDLDVVLRAGEPLSANAVAELLASLDGLPCRVDVMVETPLGGVALAELGRERVMLRTRQGVRLVRDAWAEVLS